MIFFRFALLGWMASLSAGPLDLYGLARPSIQVKGMEGGLPGSTVNDLMLDSKGQLWAGTQEGPAFQGSRAWIPFSLPSETRSQYVRALLETRDGVRWFGTQDDGLWFLKDGQWHHAGKAQGFLSSRINCLLETLGPQGQSILWAGTGGGGIARLEKGHWSFFHPKNSNLPDGFIWKLREIPDAQGVPRIWAALQTGLARLEEGHWKGIGQAQGFQGKSCNDILQVTNSEGPAQIWVSCWGQGLARWDGKTWSHDFNGESFPSRFPTALASSRTLDGQNLYWAATFDSGIAWSEGRAWRILDEKRGFPALGAYSLLVNPTGKPNLWIGSRGNGVLSIDLGGWRTLDGVAGLPTHEVTCFAESPKNDARHRFWIGTSQGLAVWEGNAFRIQGIRDGLPSAYINDLQWIPSKEGSHLWAATLKGLAVQDGPQWKSIPLPPGLSEAMATRLTYLRDARGKITVWIGTERGLGAYEDGHWKVFTTASGLPHNWVYSLLPVVQNDGTTELWVGTRGGGVARWQSGRWQQWGQEQGLVNLAIASLAQTRSQDGRSWIWAGSMGGGLARLLADDSRAQWRIFSRKTQGGFPSDSILEIEPDSQGRLYLSTPRGVARVNLEERNGEPVPVGSEQFTLGDGLPTLASSLGSAFLDQAGRIWIGTARGAAVLDPERETRKGEPSPPWLESLLVNGRIQVAKPGLSLGYRDNQLIFEFGLATSHRIEDVRFRTQLLGLEEAPTPWRTESRREFAGLSSGRYRLRVWVKDHQDRISKPLEYEFRIRPAPWTSLWAYLIYSLLASGAVFLLVRIRTRWLEQRNRLLENTVAERTRELQEVNALLQIQSMTDPLTGLFNRRHFRENIYEEAHRVLRTYQTNPRNPADRPSLNRDLLVLMVDLDLFKQVNDHHGHSAGDQVLQEFAQIIRTVTRNSDVIFRWGGEEFLILARDVFVGEAPRLAERLRLQVESHPFIVHEGQAIRLTCSIGFVAYPLVYAAPGRFTWEETVNLADQCLYEAKQAGRNRWVGLLPQETPDQTLDLDPLTASLQEFLDQGLVQKISLGMEL